LKDYGKSMIRHYIIAGICMILFLLLILLLKTVDVAVYGPYDLEIGLSTINNAFHNFTGVNIFLYKATNGLGYLGFITGGVFAVVGLVQWISRKNILKVDREVLAMGILFVVAILIYLFFEKVIVNYRPIILPDGDGPEASFPSSHTMLALSVFGSVIMILSKYVKNRSVCILLKIVAMLLIAVVIIGRLFCGAHWLTDIIGAILLGVTLLELYYALR